MNRRRISWFGHSLKDFRTFPAAVQEQITVNLRQAVRGEMPDTAKPFKGVGSGVFEIALRYRTDAYRAVYAVQIDADIWVIHAFKKKAKSGIKTPKQEVDLIRQRLKRLKEELR